MRCFGHRGAKGYVLENTIESFQKALHLGVEWIELDVQLVGEALIVFHDAKLDRLAGSNRRLVDLSPTEIATIRLEGGRRIPLLKEVFEGFAGKLKINVELKGVHGASELASFLTDAYSKGWKQEDIIVSSFNIKALKEIHSLCPDALIGLLYYGLPSDFEHDIRTCGADSVHLSLEYATEDIIRDVQRHGCKAYVYTVNDAEDISRMKEYGADGVFSDYPDRIL